MDELVRERIIKYIQRRMDEYGITAEHLMPAEEEAPPEVSPPLPKSAMPKPTPGVVQYADALGNSWDGAGAMPEWLLRAVRAGQSPDFFKRS
jgi:DNA-binding protein H-NS